MTEVYVTVFMGIGEDHILGVYTSKQKAQDAVWEYINKFDTTHGVHYGKNYNYYKVEEHQLK